MVPTGWILTCGALAAVGLLQAEAESIPELIRRLGSEQIERREEAEKALRALGERALPELRKAAEGGDPEVAAQARYLLRILEFRPLLSPKMLLRYPGVEERLAKDPGEWGALFLRAAQDCENGSPLDPLPRLYRADLEVLACQAMQHVIEEASYDKICQAICNLKLRKSIPEARRQLKSPAAHVREGACLMLMQFEDYEAVPGITALLRDPLCTEAAARALTGMRAWRSYPAMVDLLLNAELPNRELAIKCTSDLRLREALPKIRALLSDADPGVRRSAIHALGDFGDRSVLEDLAKLSRDPDDGVRHGAAFVMCQGEEPIVAQTVLDWLRNPTPELLNYGIGAAERLRLVDAVPHLLRVLQAPPKDPGFGLIPAAGRALGRIGERSCIRDLKELLRESPNEVRLAALAALSRIDAAEALPDLSRLLTHADLAVRRSVLDLVVRLPAGPAEGLLIKCLKDPDEGIRAEAILALQALPPGKFPPLLIPLLGDPSPRVVALAVETIQILKPEGSLDALLSVIGKEGAWVSAKVLRSLGIEQDLPRLRLKLRDPSPQTRSVAVTLLDKLGDTESLPQLQLMVKDPEFSVRITVAHVLARRKLAPGLEMLLRYLGEEETRQDALWRLQELGEPAALKQLEREIEKAESFERERIARQLAMDERKENLPFLFRALEDPSWQVRDSARGGLLRIDARQTFETVLKSMERQGDENWVGVALCLVEGGSFESIPLLLRKSSGSGAYEHTGMMEIAARIKSRACLSDIRAALNSESPYLIGAAAEALAWLDDRESLPAIRALLVHPDVIARHGAARALCIAGERKGVPVLLDERQSEGFVLNRIRCPDMWKKLSETKFTEPGHQTPRERLQEFAKAAGVPIVFEHVAHGDRDPLLDTASWNYRRDKQTALDGFGEGGRQINVVFESDRIRILPSEDGWKFWRRWWEESGRK